MFFPASRAYRWNLRHPGNAKAFGTFTLIQTSATDSRPRLTLKAKLGKVDTHSNPNVRVYLLEPEPSLRDCTEFLDLPAGTHLSSPGIPVFGADVADGYYFVDSAGYTNSGIFLTGENVGFPRHVLLSYSDEPLEPEELVLCAELEDWDADILSAVIPEQVGSLKMTRVPGETHTALYNTLDFTTTSLSDGDGDKEEEDIEWGVLEGESCGQKPPLCPLWDPRDSPEALCAAAAEDEDEVELACPLGDLSRRFGPLQAAHPSTFLSRELIPSDLLKETSDRLSLAFWRTGDPGEEEEDDILALPLLSSRAAVVELRHHGLAGEVLLSQSHPEAPVFIEFRLDSAVVWDSVDLEIRSFPPATAGSAGSLGSVWDPHGVGAAGECVPGLSLEDQLEKCALGDLTSRWSSTGSFEIQLSEGSALDAMRPKFLWDPLLTLYGSESVIGRSLLFRDKDLGTEVVGRIRVSRSMFRSPSEEDAWEERVAALGASGEGEDVFHHSQPAREVQYTAYLTTPIRGSLILRQSLPLEVDEFRHRLPQDAPVSLELRVEGVTSEILEEAGPTTWEWKLVRDASQLGFPWSPGFQDRCEDLGALAPEEEEVVFDLSAVLGDLELKLERREGAEMVQGERFFWAEVPGLNLLRTETQPNPLLDGQTFLHLSTVLPGGGEGGAMSSCTRLGRELRAPLMQSGFRGALEVFQLSPEDPAEIQVTLQASSPRPDRVWIPQHSPSSHFCLADSAQLQTPFHPEEPGAEFPDCASAPVEDRENECRLGDLSLRAGLNLRLDDPSTIDPESGALIWRWEDDRLSLYGRDSILGRFVVAAEEDSSSSGSSPVAAACGALLPDHAEKSGERGRTVFDVRSQDAKGSVVFSQPWGVLGSPTLVQVDLVSETESLGPGHDWMLWSMGASFGPVSQDEPPRLDLDLRSFDLSVEEGNVWNPQGFQNPWRPGAGCVEYGGEPTECVWGRLGELFGRLSTEAPEETGILEGSFVAENLPVLDAPWGVDVEETALGSRADLQLWISRAESAADPMHGLTAGHNHRHAEAVFRTEGASGKILFSEWSPGSPVRVQLAVEHPENPLPAGSHWEFSVQELPSGGNGPRCAPETLGPVLRELQFAIGTPDGAREPIQDLQTGAGGPVVWLTDVDLSGPRGVLGRNLVLWKVEGEGREVVSCGNILSLDPVREVRGWMDTGGVSGTVSFRNPAPELRSGWSEETFLVADLGLSLSSDAEGGGGLPVVSRELWLGSAAEIQDVCGGGGGGAGAGFQLWNPLRYSLDSLAECRESAIRPSEECATGLLSGHFRSLEFRSGGEGRRARHAWVAESGVLGNAPGHPADLAQYLSLSLEGSSGARVCGKLFREMEAVFPEHGRLRLWQAAEDLPVKLQTQLVDLPENEEFHLEILNLPALAGEDAVLDPEIGDAFQDLPPLSRANQGSVLEDVGGVTLFGRWSVFGRSLRLRKSGGGPEEILGVADIFYSLPMIRTPRIAAQTEIGEVTAWEAGFRFLQLRCDPESPTVVIADSRGDASLGSTQLHWFFGESEPCPPPDSPEVEGVFDPLRLTHPEVSSACPSLLLSFRSDGVSCPLSCCVLPSFIL